MFNAPGFEPKLVTGVSVAPASTHPLPATGPYVIDSYRRAKGSREGSLVLVRNPRFREWSPAAQPNGYPDRIVWRLGVGADAAVTAIERGRADWLYDGPPSGRDPGQQVGPEADLREGLSVQEAGSG